MMPRASVDDFNAYRMETALEWIDDLRREICSASYSYYRDGSDKDCGAPPEVIAARKIVSAYDAEQRKIHEEFEQQVKRKAEELKREYVMADPTPGINSVLNELRSLVPPHIAERIDD